LIRPKPGRLLSEGKELAKQIASKYPKQSFFVITKFQTDNLLRQGFLAPKQFLGTLNVFESFSMVDPGLLVHNVPLLQFATFPESLENRYYLHLASPFSYRLELLKNDVNCCASIILSVISNIVTEFVLLYNYSEPKKQLEYLNMFVQFDWSTEDPTQKSDVHQRLIEIIIPIKAALAAKVLSIDRWNKKSFLISLVKKRLKFLVNQLLSGMELAEIPVFKKAFKKQIKEYRGKFSKKKSLSLCLWQLQFPFLQVSEKFCCFEANFLDHITVLSGGDYHSRLTLETNRPGQICVIKTSRNLIQANADRIALLSKFQTAHF
jgi:hypothetical protein